MTCDLASRVQVVVHLIVKGEFLPCTDVPRREEGDPRETWVQCVDPDRVDDQIGVTLEGERLEAVTWKVPTSKSMSQFKVNVE